MKRYIVFIVLLIPAFIKGQQLPLTESYLIDPFVLSSAYAGVHNTNTLLANYRSDWTGISGGPKTFRLSYHQELPVLKNVSVGAKLMSDQMDIFHQNYFLTSYAYKLQVGENQFLNFGLSFGFYRNSIRLDKYYDSPDYQLDPGLTADFEKSKIKFMTDYGVLYRWKDLEAGMVFVNVSFGSSHYENAPQIDNKPLANYIFHAAYLYRLNGTWSIKPFVMLKAGKDIPSQLELAAQAYYKEKYWTSLLYRGRGIWSIGIGGEILEGVMLAYSYNAGYDIEISAFQNHELSLGLNLQTLYNTVRK
jgi:type IX secretion system PorP/SprF family membrane protein